MQNSPAIIYDDEFDDDDNGDDVDDDSLPIAGLITMCRNPQLLCSYL